MIQQVIGIDSWENMHSLAINNFNTPLINNNFTVLLSNMNKMGILQDQIADISVLYDLKSALNIMFSAIYLPDNTLPAADFLDDLTQINHAKGAHYVVILDRNNLKQFDVEVIIQRCVEIFSTLTIIVVNSEYSYITEVTKKITPTRSYYLGEITTIQGSLYSNVIKYVSGDRNISNKIFILDNSPTSHVLTESLPVFVDSGAASHHFVTAHGYHVFSCSSEIESSVSRMQDAVIVFNCQGFHDIERVTQQVFMFKQKFGASLRVLVKESKPCIRYNDFHMLINAGAQSIIEHHRSDSVLFDQIRLASLTKMDCHDIDLPTLQRYFQSPLTHSGIQPFDAFFKITNDVIGKIQHSQLEFALVELIPFSSVPMSEATSYCKLKRKGDIATCVNGRLVLFFSSLRLYEVSQALSNVFTVATSEIFSQTNTLTKHNEIVAKLHTLNQYSSRIEEASHNTAVKKAVLSSSKAIKVDWEVV
ncbi:BcsE family c-di-GMP-binding protein [Vibrio cionasavignyae]|uniref:BcsE family c-di-GMP-binding protein n=1 Tax=Vibrio cionasavignyae TaxID=2910252 RepID=UPI003D0CCDE7